MFSHVKVWSSKPQNTDGFSVGKLPTDYLRNFVGISSPFCRFPSTLPTIFPQFTDGISVGNLPTD